MQTKDGGMSFDIPKQPIIQKYNNENLSGGKHHQDLHQQNPFLKENI